MLLIQTEFLKKLFRVIISNIMVVLFLINVVLEAVSW
jgi:hypothetical protein